MSDFLYNYFWWLFTPFMALLIALAIYAAIADERNWQAYAQQHHCIVTGTMDASTAVGWGVTAAGKSAMVTTYIPEKTIYTCDGGEIKIR